MRAATQADRLHYEVRRKRPVVDTLSLLAGGPVFCMFPLTCTILMLLWIAFIVMQKRRTA